MVAPKLFRALNCEVIELYCEVDGNFPHHHPDPAVPKNLEDLIAAVKENQADIGYINELSNKILKQVVVK